MIVELTPSCVKYYKDKYICRQKLIIDLNIPTCRKETQEVNSCVLQFRGSSWGPKGAVGCQHDAFGFTELYHVRLDHVGMQLHLKETTQYLKGGST